LFLSQTADHTNNATNDYSAMFGETVESFQSSSSTIMDKAADDQAVVYASIIQRSGNVRAVRKEFIDESLDETAWALDRLEDFVPESLHGEAPQSREENLRQLSPLSILAEGKTKSYSK